MNRGSMTQELKALKDALLPWCFALLAVALFAFAFGIEKGYPWPSLNSISAMVLKSLTDSLVPATVQVVALSPFNVFLALIAVSLVIGLIITFPLFFYKLVHYLSPGLYPHERRGLLRAAIPASLLFGCGALFAYFIVLPQAFAVMYMFAEAAGVGELFHITEFVALVLGIVTLVGVMFQLPIGMVLLAQYGITGQGFWRNQWRQAAVAILVITAFITPDGSGLSMAMLAAPLGFLYVAGMKISESRVKQKRREYVQEV